MSGAQTAASSADPGFFFDTDHLNTNYFGSGVQETIPRPPDSDDDSADFEVYEDGASAQRGASAQPVDEQTKIRNEALIGCPVQKVVGGRNAISKRVTVELDPDDQILVQMKRDGHTDKEIRERLIAEGRAEYDVKTISSRYIRILKAQAMHMEKLLDENLDDWHEGDDELLLNAYETAQQRVMEVLIRERARLWEYVSADLRILKGDAKYSARACQERFAALEDGTAAIPPELDDDPEARQLETIKRLEERHRVKEEAERRKKAVKEAALQDKLAREAAKLAVKAAREDKRLKSKQHRKAQELAKAQAQAEKLREKAGKIRAAVEAREAKMQDLRERGETKKRDAAERKAKQERVLRERKAKELASRQAIEAKQLADETKKAELEDKKRRMQLIESQRKAATAEKKLAQAKNAADHIKAQRQSLAAIVGSTTADVDGPRVRSVKDPFTKPELANSLKYKKDPRELLNVDTLKSLCLKRNLPAFGSRGELMDRLSAADKRMTLTECRQALQGRWTNLTAYKKPDFPLILAKADVKDWLEDRAWEKRARARAALRGTPVADGSLSRETSAAPVNAAGGLADFQDDVDMDDVDDVSAADPSTL